MVEIGSLRKAVYDFSTDDTQELPLEVNDIIQVSEWIDKQWCRGVCHGRQGNFPISFTIDIQMPPLQEDQPLFASFTDFTAQEFGDLSFKKGDLIVGLREIDSNWWEGQCSGNEGIFPITHVWQVDRKLLPNATGPQKVSKKARVKMNMKAQLKQEMDLVKDDIVFITEEIDKGWYRGECNGRTGIFPSSFVTIISDNDETNADLLSCNTSIASNINETCLVPSIANSTTSDQYGYDCLNSGITAYGRSIYPFNSDYPNELTFCEGEIINLIRHVDNNWMEGEIDGRVGIFPTDFITIIVDCLNTSGNNSAETVFPPDTYGRVLRDFHSQEETKLYEGDTVILLRQVCKDSYEIQTDKGSMCVCPITLIEVIGNGPDIFPPSYSEVVKCDQNSSFHSRTDRPVSYPSTSFDQSNTGLTKTDFNFKLSHSINDKIVQNLVNLDSSGTTKARSSPSLARRSYSVDTSSHDFRNTPSSSFSIQEHGSQFTYDNVSNGGMESWSVDESLFHSSKVPVRPPPPHNILHENSSNNASRNLPSNIEDNLAVSERELNSNNQDEGAAQREIVAAQKREAEAKRRSENKRNKVKEQRDCVITEILQTERDYKSDLQILYDNFVKDPGTAKAKGIDVGTLFGNLDEVIDVSNRLVNKLQKAANAPPERQNFGQCFLEIADDMKEVYGHYCRNHDDVNAVLDKYDAKSSAGLYLKHKVEVMKRQTNCFDLPSMLIKPVQRILKYPLLLNELVKCTEDDHPDKQTLIEAIGLMTDVATAINEFKRRKDLVFKYRKHADTSLSGRISKFSIHSMLKKSSRFGMRLSNSIGLTHVTKDENFLKLERQFRSLEKTIKIFLKDLNIYIEKNEELVKTAFRMVEDIAELYQERKTMQEVDQFRSVHRMIVSQFWEANKQVLERNVIFILKQLLQTFNGPSNLIDKRSDKLLDYEACSNKLEKNKDVTKIKMLQDNLMIAKNNYEALNSQLLDDLPKFYSTAVLILRDCICCFLKAKKNFVGKTAREMLGLSELPLLLGSRGAGALETFQVKHTLVTENLSSLSIVPKQFFPHVKPSSAKRNSSPAIGRFSFGAGTNPKTQPKQSSSDIAYINSSYPTDKQYIACEDYNAVDLLDICLKRNDVVGVVKQQDPMGNNLRWFVDKGNSKGFVAAKVLKKKEISPSGSHSRDSSRNASVPPSYSVISKNIARSSAATSSTPVSNKGSVTRVPVRPAPPVSLAQAAAIMPNVPNTSQVDSTSHRYEEIDDLLSRYDTVNEEVPSSGVISGNQLPSTSGVSLDEFDPYSTTAALQVQLYDNIPNGEGDIYSDHRYEVIPDNPGPSASEYYYASFDFTPCGPNQLKMVKGQVVLVLHKCDLNQNTEWWFAEDRHGNKGYVPGNYLILYPMAS